MEIRRLTAQNAKDYQALRIIAVTLHPDAFNEAEDEVSGLTLQQIESRLRPQTSCPEQFWLGAFDKSELVGMMSFRREGLKKMKHRAYLGGLFVKPAYRGQGVSQTLIDFTISEAKTMAGLEQLHLWVGTKNTIAKALYESKGFKIIEVDSNYIKLPDQYVDLEHRVLTL